MSVTDDVDSYTDAEIARAREQLAVVGFSTDHMDSDQVAALDLLAREWLADEARSVDDPYRSDSPGVARLLEKLTKDPLSLLLGSDEVR